MDAKELRIGNLVQSKENRPFEITLEDLSFIEAGSTCKPIPLTKEWLLKFGFTEPYRKGYFVLELEDDSYLFFNNNSRGYAIKPIEKYKKSLCVYLPMAYVHQLQNLFFSLIGEELKLIH